MVFEGNPYMEFKVHLSRPDITEAEIQAVTDVLKSPNLSLGPKLTEFETAFAQYLGRKRAVAVNSGTSALFLCMLALDIAHADEVITTPFTFIASANSIMMVGAKPIFVDIDPTSLNINPDLIEQKITDKTKAILPVPVFGDPTGLDSISEIASRHNLLIIEDSCEALGSVLKGKKVGTFGTMSTFAFYPNKQMTTGEGGMIVTDDDNLADLCVSLRNQGRGKAGTWLAHERLGYNYRLSDINCALGIAQLARLDEFIQKRDNVARTYQKLIADDDRIITPQNPPDSTMSWFVFVIRLAEGYTADQRDALLQDMRQKGIQVSNYFPPVHLQPFMAEKFGFKTGDFPITESIAQRTIALPFYNNLSQQDAELVCTELKSSLDNL
jgi:perosamine synthetase